ncbi:MAG: glycosyltransferase family 4 protein [Elainellaceae cyanobacterium]
MKPLILSTSDIEGGAARAAYRLHQGFQAIGTPSQMLVRAKFGSNKRVIAEKSILTKLGPQFNNLPMRRYPRRERKLFSPQWFPDAIANKVAEINPDVVNMHWVCNGFLKIETLVKFNKPLFWTLQDMWAFTGGCHYNEGCDRYMQSCGNCPQLKSGRDRDLSRQIWQRKLKAWKDLNLTIVTPSSWMADCVRASSLFRDRRVEVISFCLDTERYRPIDTKTARDILKLPQDKNLILFGALSATADPRKGYHLLMPALQNLSQMDLHDNTELVVFGASQPEKPTELGFKAHYLGSFQDDITLAIVYSAADVMVVPSLQESFGQTASEALACGTPVVAFNATGLKDIVDHQTNGYLAQPYEIKDLANGITWVLQNQQRHAQLRESARLKAITTFSLELQAKQYLSLFTEVLHNQTRKTI